MKNKKKFRKVVEWEEFKVDYIDLLGLSLTMAVAMYLQIWFMPPIVLVIYLIVCKSMLYKKVYYEEI